MIGLTMFTLAVCAGLALYALLADAPYLPYDSAWLLRLGYISVWGFVTTLLSSALSTLV